MTLDTNNGESKFEVENSKVTVTGKVNVNTFFAHILREYIIIIIPESRML